jgi:hypothetical protein
VHLIKNYLAKSFNMDNKINFMSRILAEHGNLNRVELGDALWNSVLRPSISHCCGAWLTSSKENDDLLTHKSIKPFFAKVVYMIQIVKSY